MSSTKVVLARDDIWIYYDKRNGSMENQFVIYRWQQNSIFTNNDFRMTK